MSLATDLKIVWRESGYLPYIFATGQNETSAEWDETGALQTIPSATTLITKALLGINTYSDRPLIKKFGELKKVDERWFFVNGICTDLDTFALNCNYLSYLFGTQIIGLYNPTHGIVPDLVECVTGRTFDINEPFTVAYSSAIETALATNINPLDNTKKVSVKLIGHSQGGIIVSNIVRTLSAKLDRDTLKHLEVYTFASAADGENPSPYIYQEHYGNDEDMVHRIGLGAPEYKPAVLYRRSGGKGHLLNRNYLNAFADGKFCNKSSKLWSHLVTKK